MADRLTGIPNPRRYTGPLHGRLDEATAAVLRRWLDPHDPVHCPVVISAWSVDGQGRRVQLLLDHIWRHDRPLIDKGPRVFVRDFTGAAADTQWRELGSYVPDGPVTGSRTTANHAEEGAVSARRLLGGPATGPAAQSTLRVITAVASVEAVRAASERIPRFDVINGWDGAYMSSGVFHWTLGVDERKPVKNANGTVTKKGVTGKGELVAYIAYLGSNDALRAGHDAVARWGLVPGSAWPEDMEAIGARGLWNESQRKYEAHAAVPDPGQPGEVRVITDPAEKALLRSWHWAYRFFAIGRTSEAFQRGQWDMARLRIRDILETGLPANLLTMPGGAGAGRRPATLGECCTTEAAVAVLVRVHVNSPALVIRGGRVCNADTTFVVTEIVNGTVVKVPRRTPNGDVIVDDKGKPIWETRTTRALAQVITGAVPQNRRRVEEWTDDQRELVGQRVVEWCETVNDNARGFHDRVATWRAEDGQRLSTAARSFQLDDDGLPDIRHG